MSDDYRIAPDFTTVVLIACAIVGLLLVAGALPPLTGGDYAEAPSPTNPVEGITGEDGPSDVDQGSTEGSDSDSGTGSDEGSDNTYDITVSDEDTTPEPTPGSEVVVTVLEDGDPVEGATVEVNDDEAGITDENGEVETTVPYAEELTVVATTDDATAPAVADAPDTRTAEATGTVQDGAVSERFETDSQLSVDFSGGLFPGGTATAEVTVGDAGREVEDASITLGDGTDVTTDDDGIAEFRVPGDTSTLVVETTRGELSTREEIAMDVDADAASFPFPFAWGSTSVEATAGEHPIKGDGATIYVLEGSVEDPDVDSLPSDQVVSERSIDGSPEPVRLPMASSATIVVEAGQMTDVIVFDNLLRNLGLLVLGTTSVTYGAFVTYVRVLGRSPSRDVERVGWSLKLGAINFGWLLHRLGTTYNPLGAIARFASGVAEGIATALRAIATLRIPSLSLPSLAMPSLSLPSLSLPSLPSLSTDDVLAGRSDDEDDAEADEDGLGVPIGAYDPVDPDVPEAVELSNRELIMAAWHELAETAGVDDVETTTPGAVAASAREAGVIDDAVDVLTAVFRRIEYADVEPTDERKERALKALAAIRAAGGEEDE